MKYYKTSCTYFSGYKMDAMLMIGGRDARKKGLAVADGILQRTRNEFKRRGYEDYSAVNVELLGAEHSIIYYISNERLW